MKSAFDKISAGLNDAIAYAQGDDTRARVANIDVRAVRACTNLTRDAFSNAFRLPKATVQDWEQGRRVPDTGSAVYLRMIQADPSGVQSILAKMDS